MATCIQENGAADEIAVEVESDDDNDEDNENKSHVSQISLREGVNLFDKQVHVVGMSVDDANVLLTVREKNRKSLNTTEEANLYRSFISEKLKI